MFSRLPGFSGTVGLIEIQILTLYGMREGKVFAFNLIFEALEAILRFIDIKLEN